jgi:arginine-tRNA-protein transferase
MNLHEYTTISKISPSQIDALWAEGWRNFGTYFFRYSNAYNPTIKDYDNIIALRINLKKFTFQKSHLKLLRKTKDTKVIYQPITITEEKEKMFFKHIQRFENNPPDSIYTFLSHKPATIPYTSIECDIYSAENQLYAVSFIGLGQKGLSSIYAMFDTDYSHLSPGLHTLLMEIDYGQKNNFDYLYLGYSFEQRSFYDYKKRFNSLEKYNWEEGWEEFERLKN